MPEGPPASALVRHRHLVLVAAGALIYVAFLGLRDLWYPDEPDIGEVCRAMYVGGDWIVPYRNGEPWIDYWPGLYWAGTLASHAVGGMSEFSLRLPSAIAGILLALWTCSFASRRFGPHTGLWAGLLLLTFQQFAYNAVSYRPDVLFSLFASGGLLLYATGSGDQARWLPRIGGFALFGAAVLVKGPLGLLLPGLVLTLWHGSRREWGRLFGMAPLTLVAIAVALPWALACASATSAEWFWGEIYAQNFMRFDEGGRGHVKPWHYYLTRIWADLAPWSPLLPFAFVSIWRSPVRKDRFVQLAAWWFTATFVFLSYATTKRQLYLLPAYPAVALLMAPYLAAVVEGAANVSPRPARWLAGAFSGLLVLVGVAGVVAGLAFEPIVARLELDDLALPAVHAARLPALFCGVAFVALGVWTLRALRLPSAARATSRMMAATIALYALVVALLLPAANPARTYAPECRWIREQIGPEEDRFGLLFPTLAHHKMGAFGYYTGAVVALLYSEDDVDEFFATHPDSIVLVHEDSLAGFLASTRTDWQESALRPIAAGGYRYTAFRRPK